MNTQEVPAAPRTKRRLRVFLLLGVCALGLAWFVFWSAGAQRRLIADLKNPNPAVRIRALVALGDMEDDPTVVEHLNAALKDSDAKVRFRAAAVLAALKDPRSVEPLMANLRDTDRDVRESAAIALREIGARSVPFLVAALKDENWDVRALAAESLGGIKDPYTVEPLLDALLDENSGIQNRAALALAEIGEPAFARLAPYLRDRDLKSIAKTYPYFIIRGEPGSEDVLVQTLNTYGTETMAREYLTCGNPALVTAGQNWATSHGYSVQYVHVPSDGTGGGHWGSLH